jgi:hypothetical protein
MKTIERPEIVENKHLKYLDNLRDLGTMNMHGAPTVLAVDFDLDDKQAKVIVKYWMDSYMERHV